MGRHEHNRLLLPPRALEDAEMMFIVDKMERNL